MAKALSAIDAHHLDNIRLHDGDATELLPRLPAGSIARVFLLYPDPWPKRRQRKRRFVNDATVTELARIMKPGAMLRFATDIDDYAGWTLARLQRSGRFAWMAERADDWRKPFPGWPGTRYEAKALREGRRPVYLTFTRG
jgi:tRNA (guanine-N7-)-methyltransferase